MNIRQTMIEMYMVTDDQGEVLAGPFFYPAEANEWIQENGGDDDE